MSKTLSGAQILRERTLYQYAQALEAGDFATLARIHAQAETDALLEQQLTALQEAAVAALPEVALAEDAALVRGLLARHLTPGLDEASEPAPITVGEVAGKLHSERRVPAADLDALARLRDLTTPVPRRPALSAVRALGQELGVRASESFWRLFREAALLLGVSHSQQAGFAAARRQTTDAGARSDERRAEPAPPAGPDEPGTGDEEEQP